MVKVGQLNCLRVIKEVPFGVYLDGGERGEILLPLKYVPSNVKLDEELEVFIYFDSEDHIIATTQKPKATLGSCAYLKVIDINPVGAFLDWGLDKDLLAPKPEQRRPMELGKSYIVHLKQDGIGRIVATSKFDRFLDKRPSSLKPWDEVSLIIAEKSDLGTKVIINDSHWGLVHSSDIFQQLSYGMSTTGFVKNVRKDGKIDIVFNKPGQSNINKLAERILKKIQNNGGFLPLHDKSSAEEIKRELGESKSSFKVAIGQLYKSRKIKIEVNGISLAP